MNLFDKQAEFMLACDQKINRTSPSWDIDTQLWVKLIDEEYDELMDEAEALTLDFVDGEPLDLETHEKLVKEATDLLYVTLGLLNTLGIDPVEAFNLLHDNNMTKPDPETGKVTKTSYGKVIKPDWYVPVDFSTLYKR